MSEKIKRAESGIPDISAHRTLAPHEEDALEAGKKRWLPRIFQSYGTPIPDLMASPLKTGLIFGVPAGLLGAGIGSAIGGTAHGSDGKGYSGMGALIGGLGAGGLAAIAAGMDREAKNEGLEELMRRMPEGAAKRDLEADPQYQADFLGWDNNKIVATARARYYRPTERFSKRTSDMADARARYNERHKSSSINKDVSMSENEKQAMKPETQLLLNYLLRTGVLGSAVGGAAGAVTSKNKLRGMARGMLMGAGTGLGIGAGLPVGAGLGGGAVIGLTGAPKSYQGLSNVGNAATLGAGVGGTFGGMAGHAGGKALADALVGPAEDEDGNIPATKKKEAHALLNNTTLTLAEKMAAYAELLKKHADLNTSATMGASIPPSPGLAMSAPPGFDPSSASMPISPTTGLPINMADAPAPAGAPAASGGGKWRPPAMIPDMSASSGTGAVSRPRSAEEKLNDKVYWEYFNKNLDTAKRMGIGAGKGIGSALSFIGQKGQDAVGAGMGAGSNLLKWLKPDAPPPPSMLDQLKPYAPYAAIGAGGLGAIALADYLSRRNKKKKRPQREEDEGDYEMPKAASMNWYALTKATNNPMEKQAISTYLRMMARLQRLGRNASGAATTGLDAAKGYAGRAAEGLNALPQWAKITGGVGAAGAGGALFGALGNMALRDEPGMLQQIMNSKYTPYAAAGLGTAGLLGGAAYLGSRAGKNDAKKKKPEVKTANLGDAGLGAGAGAAALGAGGALFGALAPGHETDPMTGRRKRRSRLMGALRGLAGGAAVGGAAGGAAGYFGGDKIRALLEAHLASKQQGAGSPEKGISTDATMQPDLVEAAKAEAAKNPAPQSPVIPQGPADASATMGASVPPAPALQNSMPVQSPAPGPMPSASPAAGLSQGPTNFNSTMGARVM